MSFRRSVAAIAAAAILSACATHEKALAAPAELVSSLAKMPVKEITVFKDGHAFVLHEGNMPTDRSGNVVMDYLPTPILGTFWPYSNEKSVKLTAVVASHQRVLVPRTALTVFELIDANPGAPVQVTELRSTGTTATVVTYDATIVGIPTRSAEELEATSPPNSGEKLPEKGALVMLRTTDGVITLPIDRIQTITFKGDYKPKVSNEEFRNLLTLKLDGTKGGGDTANVGMMYLQKGLRWIPSYRVSLNDGQAHVKLQATLVNELTDLQDVTANLVIGVPSFAFKHEQDPIALQQALAAMSGYYAPGSRMDNALSNAIMSQTANMQDRRAMSDESNVDMGPEVQGSTKNEDLFIYNVKHVTLKKGQRMVLPVAEFDLPYKDIYTLDVPFTPPQELNQYLNVNRSEIAKLMQAPKVQHKIRLSNSSQFPLTTAPALVMRDNQVLAQGTMTYAAPGSTENLDLTTAVDVRVKKTDKETARVPNAATFQGDQYARIELAGTLALTNFSNKNIEIEVKREVLGKVKTADNGGTTEMINVFEDTHQGYPSWWSWYSWPSWWHRMNGVGRITWKVPLKPKEKVDLNYTWSYFYR
jgi:hypothetical protein